MMKPSTSEFINAITDDEIRRFQILVMAFITGITLCGAVILYLSKVTTPTGKENPVLFTMTAVTFFSAMTMFPLALSSSFFARILRGAKKDAPENSLDAHGYLLKIQSAVIVRIAFFEAPAMIGLCTCFIGVFSGMMREYPVLLINVAVPALALAGMATMIPNRDKLKKWYELIL